MRSFWLAGGMERVLLMERERSAKVEVEGRMNV